MAKTKAPTTTAKPATVAHVAKAPHVALRGGAAVAQVALVPSAVYRTKAPHNLAWWATITQATKAGPAPVATLCAPLPTGLGVPTHFVGYCIRRGYLAAA